MAIDKNSKAYQALLNSGYTDEQINQMHGAVASGQSTQEAVNSVPTPNYENQWAGNYVYNPVTEYYENTSAPRNTQTTTPTQTSSTPKQDTWVKQSETQGNTVSEIKQEWELKPLSQEYYNQTSDEALRVIRDNLERYKQTNPEYFTNYESFKKNFSYDTRNDVQKNALDQWYQWYQEQLQLATTPTTDLYTQYSNWQISAAELEQLRISNPQKYAELQAQINKWNILAAYDDDNKWDTWMSIQDMAYNMAMQIFSQFMSWDDSTWASNIFREYEEKMESPEMIELSDKCTEIDEARDNINDDIATMTRAIEDEYAGTWATRSKINAIIADRTYDLQLQLRTLDSEYKKYATQYNNRMNQYQSEFSMQLQEYQINQQERTQKMNELGFALDLMNFETNEQKAEREWNYRVKEQEYTNWNINSKDYDTRYKAALKSVQWLLSQYEGIPMVRSAEQMAQDILTAIDNGSNLWAELTKINQQIQQKPEYKYLYNNTFRPATSGTGLQSYKVWDTEYVVYNGEMMTAEDFNKRYWGKATWATWSAKPYNIVDSRALSSSMMSTIWGYDGNTLWLFLSDAKNQKGKNWWWCGAFVNRYLKSIWATNENYYDDELSTKLNSVNSLVPTVWAVAVFDFWHITKETWKNHWHVWIVTKVYEDGSFDVIESNYNSDKKVWVRTHINPQSSTVKWFFDPSQAPAGTWGTTEGWTLSWLNNYSNVSTADSQKAEAMLKQIKTWNMTPSDTSAARDWLIENGYGEQFMEALDMGLSVSLNDTQKDLYKYHLNNFNQSDLVKDFKNASSQITNLITSLNANNWAWDLAWIFQFMKVLDPNSVVREQEFKNAAKTAWYANPKQLWQQYVKHGWDGTWLTDAQRWNFSKLAKELIKWQAEMYNLEYEQLKKSFNNAGIDIQWLPINYADEVLNRLDWKKTSTTTTQTTTVNGVPTYVASLMSGYSPTWLGNVVNAWWYYFTDNFYSNNYLY